MKRALTILSLLVALPGVASAQDELPQFDEPAGSPRRFLLELNAGGMRPVLDDEPGLTLRPYNRIFANEAMWMIDAEFDVEIFQAFGTLALAGAGSMATVHGKGLVTGSDARAPDSTSLRTLPFRALVVYRFDWFARELGIPLVPFGKAGLAYTFWWATDGNGDIARLTAQDGSSAKARGGKWGYQLSAGLAFELNFLDPSVAREFDADVGVNSSYISAQWVRLGADNFGGKGLDLSGDAWLVGLALEF